MSRLNTGAGIRTLAMTLYRFHDNMLRVSHIRYSMTTSKCGHFALSHLVTDMQLFSVHTGERIYKYNIGQVTTLVL